MMFLITKMALQKIVLHSRDLKHKEIFAKTLGRSVNTVGNFIAFFPIFTSL